MNAQPTFRFAPSPTGHLHIGHAFSAIAGYRLARRQKGRFLLRIEDTDLARCRPEFVTEIFRDLGWLGLEWEEPVIYQSQRLEIYGRYLKRLSDQGLIYPCFATRKDIAAATLARDYPRDPDGAPLYPGLHKNLSPCEIEARFARGERPAFRLDIKKACRVAERMTQGAPLTYSEFTPDGHMRSVKVEPGRWGDIVLARKDTGTSYHLAGVVDDALSGVTHVVRGKDLQDSSDIHRLLQAIFGLPVPYYHHHQLVLDSDGCKLSKRRGDPALSIARHQGQSSRVVYGALDEYLRHYQS